MAGGFSLGVDLGAAPTGLAIARGITQPLWYVIDTVKVYNLPKIKRQKLSV